MYVCVKTPPKPLNQFAYELYQQLECLTLIAIGYLDLKYLPNTMNIVPESAVAQAYLRRCQWQRIA